MPSSILFGSGQYKVVRMLVVEQQARVDLHNWEGWVPMVWAIVRGHTQIVKFLSERVSLSNVLELAFPHTAAARWTIPVEIWKDASCAGLKPAVEVVFGLDSITLCSNPGLNSVVYAEFVQRWTRPLHDS